MYTDKFESLMQGKIPGAPFNEWNKVWTDIYRRTTEENLQLLSDTFSHLSQQCKHYSNVKNPEEFFKIHKECINDCVTTSVENLQKLSQATLKNIEDISKLCGTPFGGFEKFKTTDKEKIA